MPDRLPPKPCAACGKDFTPKKDSHRYCYRCIKSVRRDSGDGLWEVPLDAMEVKQIYRSWWNGWLDHEPDKKRRFWQLLRDTMRTSKTRASVYASTAILYISRFENGEDRKHLRNIGPPRRSRRRPRA